MNSAENLCRRIIEDAKAAVAEKQTASDAECEAIREAARVKAAAFTAEAEAQAKARRAAFEERAEASGQKITRNAVLLEKAKILNSVTAEAAKALCALDGEPYVTFVASLYASCGALVNPVVSLQADREPQKAALSSRLGGARLVFDKNVDGGILVSDGDISYDCKVSTLLSKFRAEHEPELQNILFGE